MARLRDKVAFITGAAGGIGFATAKRFVAEGAEVFLTDVDQTRLDGAVRELGGTHAAALEADISEEAQVARAYEACLERFGGLDIVFANAGTEGHVKPLVEMSLEEFDAVQRVNVRGAWLTVKHGAQAMLERGGGGAIVITSSIAGFIGSPGLSSYVTSKHGVNGLAKTAALELGPQGIRVNTVNPGPVDNRMMRSIEQQLGGDSPEAVKQQFQGMVPLGRYATNEDIANAVLYLASDEAAFVHGANLVVDGGFLDA